MICEQVKGRVDEYIDAMMDECSKKSFESHLSECRECHRYVEEMKDALQWIQQANDVQPPSGLRPSVLDILRREKQTNRRTLMKPGFAQAFAAAAVFLLLVAGNLLPFNNNSVHYSKATGRDTMALEADNPGDAANPAVPDQENMPEEQPVRTTNVDSSSKGDGTGVSVQNKERFTETDDTKTLQLPYRLILNITGIPVMLLLLLVGLKKRREVLP